MTNDTEPRALGAALSAPAFVTRGHGVAMHAANRHVERWAPEANAGRVRSLRSLGFVDRLVAPWMETAQRSASMRLFSQYAQSGPSPREPGAVSWVFPRPWYQDELDWMAAARQNSAQVAAAASLQRSPAPTLLTTRGTYVAPAAAEISAPAMMMPSALYEYVAPSLSIAASQRPQAQGVGFGGETQGPSSRGEAYSSLVSLAAVQAAELMSRTVAPLAMQTRGAGATTAMTPGLRAVLASILERAATPQAHEIQPTRLSLSAPELVTPPSPRAPLSAAELGHDQAAASPSATQVAEQYAAQRSRIVELQRIAQQAAQRELAARSETLARSQPRSSVAAASHQAQAEHSTQATQVVDQAAQVAARAEQAASKAELRSTAERAEAELLQRVSAVDAQRQAEAASAADAVRTRSVEPVAQRLAHPAGAQRLHEQARAEAAVHARMALEPSRRGELAIAASTTPRQAPAEVTAAMAGLPPELAAMLGAAMSQRPERAVQAIHELSETLRTVELLARSSASGAAFEVTRGPRMMMPAGLGGLVNAIDRAQLITERPAMLGGARPLAPLAQFVAPEPQAAQSRAVRMPQLSWLTAAPRAQGIAPTTALGATATAAPAALSHVAWTDRWLARFAGAAPQSLDLITAMAGAAPALRMQALANAAPGAVFVAPDFQRNVPRSELTAEQAAYVSAQARSGAAAPSMAPPPAAATGIPGMRLINPPAPSEPIRRFDDAAETPDDVFAVISQAASRGRGRSAGATTSPAAPASVAAAVAPAADRQTYADLVAHAAPSAPGPGLSAQLASSPFAPALRHVLPLPAAASFDVRSLFGAGLGATYLAGLLGAASHELQIGAQLAPTWAAWEHAPIGGQLGDSAERIDRMVPVFDAAYVSPDAFQRAGVNAAAEPQASPEVRAVLEAGDGRTVGETPAADLTLAPGATEIAAAFAASRERGANVPLTTLRTALLSWGVMVSDDTAGQPGVPQLVPLSFATASQRDVTQSTSTARMMIDAMSMPMLGDAGPEPSSAWAAPGMVADRAQSWSVAQERSSSDLSLDFVTPELVLAARVYGLGPAEVAQAARLAIVGPGQLGAMASAVDRTFVDAMAIVREARGSDAERRYRSSPPGGPGAAREVSARDLAAGDLVDSSAAPGRAEIATAFPTSDGDIAAAIAPTTRVPISLPPSGAAFGVDRRSPRGAFLWPQATVAALGMTAAGSDGQLSMSVAALELLAAQVVAEVGTYAALSEADAGARALAGEAESGTDAEGGSERGVSAASRTTMPATATAELPGALIAGRDARAPASSVEPGEAEVLGAAASFVPAARRARFDALYVALSQTTAGRSWSPAARAARALALAGRGDDSAVTARERAATAWDVLPVVYPGHGDTTPYGAEGIAAASAVMAASYVAPGASDSLGGVGMRTTGGARSTGTPSGAMSGVQRGGARLPSGTREVAGADAGFAMTGLDIAAERPYVTVSPGLAGLSARAGDALGSYVSPVAPPSAPVARERREPSSVGAVLRPPTAAQEYVQTGRSGGRYGGNEVEIPPWFEAAARKMLSDRSDNADGISLAELTLVSAAPASHIAASTRSAPSAASPAPAVGGAGQTVASQIDVDKLANDVYREILVMMDVARARNGEPYL